MKFTETTKIQAYSLGGRDADAQRDDRLAEYRCRPPLNDAKFG